MKIKRKPVMASRGYNDDTVFVIFRKVRVDGQWIPCAFWYSSGQTLNYGRLYVIEPESYGYVCEEADMGYYNASKKLTPADPGYDDLKEYTYDYLTDHGDGQGGFKKIVERQKVDYNALRNSWYRDTIPDDDSVEYSVNSSTRSRKRPVTATTWGIDDPRSDYLESKNYKKVVFNGRGQYERGYSKQYMTADHRIGSISVNPHDDYAVTVYIMDDRYVDHRIDIPAGVPSNLSADNYENDLASIEEFLYNYSLNEYGYQRASTSTRKRPVTASEDAGESEEIYYDVYINDNPNGSYYETLEDAVDTAKEYASDPQYADDEITVVLEHYVADSSGEIIDWYDDNGDVMWNSNDAIYESTQITAADDANGYEDLAMSLGDAIKRLASDEDHLNNFISYLTQHFPEWLQKFAKTPEGLVSEFNEFANMNF